MIDSQAAVIACLRGVLMQKAGRARLVSQGQVDDGRALLRVGEECAIRPRGKLVSLVRKPSQERDEVVIHRGVHGVHRPLRVGIEGRVGPVGPGLDSVDSMRHD